MKMIFSKEKFYATLTKEEMEEWAYEDREDSWPNLCDGREVEWYEGLFDYVVHGDDIGLWFINPSWCISIED